jgi:flagellar biosynthesis protein FlhF
MKIQRYIAKDMRSALAQVREALGADAVILSSGRVGNDVEVIAAIDMESVQQAAATAVDATPRQARTPQRSVLDVREDSSPLDPDEPRRPEVRQEVRQDVRADARFAAPRAEVKNETPERQVPRREVRASSQLSEEVAPPYAQPAAPAADTQAALASEMKDMRRMLEAQLETLTWNDFQRRSPVQAAMLKEMAQLGMSQDLANSLVRKIPRELNFNAARRFALATIARTLQVTGDRWLERGGIVAFAGPAGAGKTTLLAKLAARWVLRHGPRRVAMISADSVRIGAHEQFHTLGRLLGVTTHNVFDIAELPELLYELRNCQLVMIDTAGTSPRDPELARQLRLLSSMQASIETALVLPASTQSGAIDEVVTRFALAKPTSCCITKVDEAVNLGGMLSALIRHRLAAAYVSDGQRVPEDLAPARAHALVSKAVEIASHNGNTADDEVMQRRMTGAKNVR